MLGDRFQVAYAQRASNVVNHACTLCQHRVSGCLAFGDITERTGVVPQQTNAWIFARHFGVLGVTPVHTVTITRFKFV